MVLIGLTSTKDTSSNFANYGSNVESIRNNNQYRINDLLRIYIDILIVDLNLFILIQMALEYWRAHQLRIHLICIKGKQITR